MASPAAVTRRTPGSDAARVAFLTTLLLLSGPVPGATAQDWSGASLRGARELALPEGYQTQVLALGLRLPQDLAVDPPDGLWVLTRGAPGQRGAGALVRIPLDAPGPMDASQLPGVLIPFASSSAPFEVGSVARHPGSGNLYVTEARGHHLFRVTRDGRVTVFARGGHALVDGRALVFDAQGQLLILNLAGLSTVAEATTDPLRELLGSGDPYQGPVVHRLRVDEALPLPRNLEYAGSAFPPAALRRRTVVRPRYNSLASLPSGELVVSAHGVIDQLRPDGTIARLAQLTGASMVVAGDGGVLYALDHLGADRPRPRRRHGGAVRRGAHAAGGHRCARRRHPGRRGRHRPSATDCRAAPDPAVTTSREVRMSPR